MSNIKFGNPKLYPVEMPFSNKIIRGYVFADSPASVRLLSNVFPLFEYNIRSKNLLIHSPIIKHFANDMNALNVQHIFEAGNIDFVVDWETLSFMKRIDIKNYANYFGRLKEGFVLTNFKKSSAKFLAPLDENKQPANLKK